MQDTLKLLRSTTIKDNTSKDQQIREAAVQESASRPDATISDPDQALGILQAQPSLTQLSAVLRYLDSTTSGKGSINIRHPSAKSASLLNVLVGPVVSDYWKLLQPNGPLKDKARDSQYDVERSFLLNCLGGVNGLGALEARLRALLNSRDAVHNLRDSSIASQILILLDLLGTLLQSDEFIWNTWADFNAVDSGQNVQMLMWRELLALICFGKLLSVAAEGRAFAETVSKETDIGCWVGDGVLFSRWLGRNIARMSLNLRESDKAGLKAVSQALTKSFSLGYTDEICRVLYTDLLLNPNNKWANLRTILKECPRHQQRLFMHVVLRHLSNNLLALAEADHGQQTQNEDQDAITAGAALIAGLAEENEFLKDSLVSWLAEAGGGINDRIPILRAVIAAVASDRERIERVLERTVQQFGDKLYIRHSPILLQEANAQVLLLAVGCVHRRSPEIVHDIAHSSVYLNGISNRLATSSSRSRHLGMIVANAISSLVDGTSKRKVFSMDELNTVEVEKYFRLTRTSFRIGSVRDLKSLTVQAPVQSLNTEARSSGRTMNSNRVSRKESLKASPITTITQNVVTSHNGLIPYEKPDSDAEDDDEDPTLVNRTKHDPPVYIRQLIDGLRDSENYERQRVALSAASGLIRRKAAFGTEFSTNAEELATILTGLQDKFDMENFQEWRLQGLIAILVAQPVRMGQWFSKAFFNGDYSMSQRASILSTLGMGARELGGYNDEESAALRTPVNSIGSFPSKLLPEKLHKAYTEPTHPVDALATRLERTMIQPMALEAADKLAGPDALKVRTFSSRMEVDKKRKKPVRNELAKVVTEAFFYPMVGHWWVQLKSYGAKSVYFSPFLLAHYIKTLAIIVHASGTSTTLLSQVTSEFWDLLLSITSHPSHDSTVLESLLFAFLTILEVNEDKRRLVEEQSRELVETQRWTESIFENAPGGDEESDRVKMLAASVLIKLKDIVEKYQRLLVGELA